MRAPGEPKVKVNFAVVIFDQIKERATREPFNAMPTTFRLSRDEVDVLVAESGQLLERSSEYRDFLRQIDQPLPDRPRVGADTKK